MTISSTMYRLEHAGVHVSTAPTLGPLAGHRTALVTRLADDTWLVQCSATAPPVAVGRVLSLVAALRQYGAGNRGWTPGPDGSLWAYF